MLGMMDLYTYTHNNKNQRSTRMEEIKRKAKERLNQLWEIEVVRSNQIKELSNDLEEKKGKLNYLKDRVELLRIASITIHHIIDTVSTDNIRKVENLVNHALSHIFYDLDLNFHIEQSVKRNMVIYNAVITEDGVEGSINSYGGGVISAISFVLKCLFNLLSNKFPLVIFDESLGFLADKYIPNASNFIKEITQELKIPVVLVTHQKMFIQESDNVLEVHKVGTSSLIKVG